MNENASTEVVKHERQFADKSPLSFERRLTLNLHHSLLGWAGIACALSGAIMSGLGLLGVLPLGAAQRGWLIPLGCVLGCGPQVIELVVQRLRARSQID